MASLQLIHSTTIHAGSSGCHSGELALPPRLLLPPKNNTNNHDDIDEVDDGPKSKPHRALMIIAIYPNSPRKIAALWSQLECFSHSFDDVVISSPVHLHNETMNFMRMAQTKLPPETWKKTKVKFYVNDRHDMGLWCDALDDVVFRPSPSRFNSPDDATPSDERLLSPDSIIYDVGVLYDEIMLVNDSIIAVERTDVFLSKLRSSRLSLLSLNYRNGTDGKFWLESPLRVFDRRGIHVFSRNICRIRSIRWRRDCPHVGKIYRPSERDKRCVVEKTEIDLVDHFEEGEVSGLFAATNEKGEAWIDTVEYWEHLRGLGFPVGKVSRERMFQRIKASRREDLLRCTEGLGTDWLD